MECKNCKTTLKETANFCDECGSIKSSKSLLAKYLTKEIFVQFILFEKKNNKWITVNSDLTNYNFKNNTN